MAACVNILYLEWQEGVLPANGFHIVASSAAPVKHKNKDAAGHCFHEYALRQSGLFGRLFAVTWLWIKFYHLPVKLTDVNFASVRMSLCLQQNEPKSFESSSQSSEGLRHALLVQCKDYVAVLCRLYVVAFWSAWYICQIVLPRTPVSPSFPPLLGPGSFWLLGPPLQRPFLCIAQPFLLVPCFI